MKRLFAVIIMVVLALSIGGMGGIAQAEYEFPGDGYNKGTMGTDGKPFREFVGNTVVLPGATDNAFETRISPVEPTGVNIVLVPDESGTFVTTGSSSVITNGSITAGTDGTIMISNDVGAGTVIWAAHALTGDVTGTMLNSGGVATTLTPGTDGQILISNNSGGGESVWVAISGDVALTNAGVTSLNANTVTTSEAFINTVSLVIANASAINSVAVESGSTLLGFYVTTTGGLNTVAFLNAPFWDGSTLTVTTNATILGGDAIVSGTFLRP